MQRAILARVVAALLLPAACTEGSDGAAPTMPDPVPGSARANAEPPVIVPVLDATRPDVTGREDVPLGQTVLAGMRLAEGRDPPEGARPVQLNVMDANEADVEEVLASSPPIILVVGDASAVVAARHEVEAAQVPVVVVGDDLYTPQQLHRYVFQTSIPVRWQARVLASYFIEDRGEERVVIVADADDEGWVHQAFGQAFAEEGGPAPTVIPDSGPWLGELREVAASADAVVALLPPETAAALGLRKADLGDVDFPGRLVVGSTSVAPDLGGALPIGSGFVLPYTWAGWADMLPRVRAFRELFMSVNGLPPGGLEQEGYDAVMAVSEALGRTDGAGGEALVRALEGFREETYSSLPIRLGPDDHVFAEQSHLGLFAVVDPAAVGRPGETYGSPPLAPVMRTFTTDGEKVNLLDRDKRIFFPFWRPKRPTPKYWRSEYGIISRSSDPLH